VLQSVARSRRRARRRPRRPRLARRRLRIGRPSFGGCGDATSAVALGQSNRDIAAALDIGDETVKTHVANLLAKLGVENRAQATVEALRRGLVSLDELDSL
jgi:FixJ family two-component response regulator